MTESGESVFAQADSGREGQNTGRALTISQGRKTSHEKSAEWILENIMHRKNWGIDVRDDLADYLEQHAYKAVEAYLAKVRASNPK